MSKDEILNFIGVAVVSFLLALARGGNDDKDESIKEIKKVDAHNTLQDTTLSYLLAELQEMRKEFKEMQDKLAKKESD